MGLHSLRHHLSVIPQVPFLFKGDVKSNLDPFGFKTDEELWSVLEKTNLKEAVEAVNIFLFSSLISSIPIYQTQHKFFQWERDSYYAWLEPSSRKINTWFWMKPLPMSIWKLISSFKNASRLISRKLQSLQ